MEIPRYGFYKSAATSRGSLRPLRGAFLKFPALLVVADLSKIILTK
jgi:hypothetical protein